VDDADVVVTLKTLERKESERLKSIAAENVPIYSIKTNTTTQIQSALKDVFNLPALDVEEIAMREAEEAVYQVLLDSRAVELSPQTSYVRRQQHLLAERSRCNRAAPVSNPTAACASTSWKADSRPDRHAGGSVRARAGVDRPQDGRVIGIECGAGHGRARVLVIVFANGLDM